jgi:hypothetical protein
MMRAQSAGIRPPALQSDHQIPGLAHHGDGVRVRARRASAAPGSRRPLHSKEPTHGMGTIYIAQATPGGPPEALSEFASNEAMSVPVILVFPNYRKRFTHYPLASASSRGWTHEARMP